MSEERLKEIKDSIYIAHRISCDPAISTDFRDKEELYNEVVRLREIIKKIENKSKFINQYFSENKGIQFMQLLNNQHEILDILKQYNLTLEQINGIDNE